MHSFRLAHVPVSEARRIEILASALPVWHGAQVAIDATMVSHSEGTASPEAAVPDKLGLCLSKRRGENGRRLTRSCLRHGGLRH